MLLILFLRKKFSFQVTLCLILLLALYSPVNTFNLSQAQADTLVPITVPHDTNITYIARDFCYNRSSWSDIAKINNLKAPYKIYQNTTIFIPLSLLITENLNIKVASLYGEVKLFNGNNELRTLQKDDLISVGQTIKTGNDSFVHLILPDNKYTRIAPNSSFGIDYLFRLTDKSVKANFFLEKGRITHDIKQKLKRNELFQTRTPVSLTGVRGTEFRVKMINETTNYIETLSGSVQVDAAGSSISVAKGEGLQVAEGEKLKAPRPLPTTPTLPALQSVYRTLPISFYAPAHNNAEFIRLRMCTDAGGNDTFLEMIVKPEEKFIIPTLADGIYYTFVTAIDEQKFESLPSKAFVVKVRTVPSAPIVSTPKNGLVTFDKHISSNWLGSEHVEYYNLLLATDPEFSTIIETKRLTIPEYTSAELEANTYYFKVQGVAPDGFKTLFSTPISWSTSDQPTMGETNTSSNDRVSFQWSEMKEEGTYDIQIAKDKGFTNLILSETGLTTSSYQVTKTLYPGDYYVRVRGVLVNGTPSQWTASQILTIEKGPLGLIGVITILGILLIALL